MLTFVLLSMLLLSDPLIQGRVVDSENQKPIPYAYIQFLDDGGTYITSNAEGEFKFEVNENRKKGRIYVRAIGYEEATINFDASESLLLEVKLKLKEIQLDELVVKGRKVTPRILGQINASTSNFGENLPNPAIAFDLSKQKGKLTRLHFSLSGDNGFPEAPTIINLYIFPRFASMRASHYI